MRLDGLEPLEAIARLGRSGRRIVIGPWLTEVGFELLYWIPFVRWAVQTSALDAAQLVAVSRGGCASWYADITPHYRDLFDVLTPDEFRDGNLARMKGAQPRRTVKQLSVSDFDRLILDRLDLGDAELLHPATMYRLFRSAWRQPPNHGIVDACTRLAPIARPTSTLPLPTRYIAAKFYTSGALPDSSQSRALVDRVLATVTATTDVVLLHTGLLVDDHADSPIGDRSRVHRVDHLMTPATNLDVQTRVIAGAAGFIGTYGGFSYLAPLLGVSSETYYSVSNSFRQDHLDRAVRVFREPPYGAFKVRGPQRTQRHHARVWPMRQAAAS